MDFESNLQQCPTQYIREMRQLDTTVQDDADIISDMFRLSYSDSPCIEALLVTLAKKIGSLTNQLVFSEFLAAVTNQRNTLSDEAKNEIKHGILRGGYRPSISVAMHYFNALRYNQIDIRPYLEKEVIEDWSFTHPRDNNAATWHYYLYLISLNEPDAVEAIEKKLAATMSGNDVTSFLKSVYELKSAAAYHILQRYKDDERRADGADGPGMRISETVKIYLPYLKEHLKSK